MIRSRTDRVPLGWTMKERPSYGRTIFAIKMPRLIVRDSFCFVLSDSFSDHPRSPDILPRVMSTDHSLIRGKRHGASRAEIRVTLSRSVRPSISKTSVMNGYHCHIDRLAMKTKALFNGLSSCHPSSAQILGSLTPTICLGSLARLMTITGCRPHTKRSTDGPLISRRPENHSTDSAPRFL
ncbi:hypothetical protein LY76DRAFT_427067 [Colletotrichum caudatum]|nr:hypothetical protein LY76DRAFT_427067 [Colletotrichum caudatum]